MKNKIKKITSTSIDIQDLEKERLEKGFPFLPVSLRWKISFKFIVDGYTFYDEPSRAGEYLVCLTDGTIRPETFIKRRDDQCGWEKSSYEDVYAYAPMPTLKDTPDFMLSMEEAEVVINLIKAFADEQKGKVMHKAIDDIYRKLNHRYRVAYKRYLETTYEWVLNLYKRNGLIYKEEADKAFQEQLKEAFAEIEKSRKELEGLNNGIS